MERVRVGGGNGDGGYGWKESWGGEREREGLDGWRGGGERSIVGLGSVGAAGVAAYMAPPKKKDTAHLLCSLPYPSTCMQHVTLSEIAAADPVEDKRLSKSSLFLLNFSKTATLVNVK